MTMVLVERPNNNTDYPAESLTPAEHEVMKYLAHPGWTNADIAEKLCVTPSTVKFHCINIYQKLGVSSKREAIEVYYPELQEIIITAVSTTAPNLTN